MKKKKNFINATGGNFYIITAAKKEKLYSAGRLRIILKSVTEKSNKFTLKYPT